MRTGRPSTRWSRSAARGRAHRGIASATPCPACRCARASRRPRGTRHRRASARSRRRHHRAASSRSGAPARRGRSGSGGCSGSDRTRARPRRSADPIRSAGSDPAGSARGSAAVLRGSKKESSLRGSIPKPLVSSRPDSPASRKRGRVRAGAPGGRARRPRGRFAPSRRIRSRACGSAARFRAPRPSSRCAAPFPSSQREASFSKTVRVVRAAPSLHSTSSTATFANESKSRRVRVWDTGAPSSSNLSSRVSRSTIAFTPAGDPAATS